MRTLLTLLFICFCNMVFCQGNINVMYYNLYRFPAQPPVKRENILRQILDAYKPDLLMCSELVNEDGADRILDSALNYNGTTKYARAEFVPMQSDASDALQQMVFYNKEKLSLLQQKTYPTKVRDINHYTFQLNTIGVPVSLDAFVTHLKSSEGPANRQLRLEMTDTFVKKLADVSSGHYVLFAGDFNFYSSYTEPAYQRMLDTSNTIVMVDPTHMPGNWSDNDTFKTIHTQATRLSTDGFGQGGASGGMDDRFDFIMMSKSLEGNGHLRYAEGSYKAYGNNGNCFNNRIDAYDCEGPYSLVLRQHLYNMSDHLPVVMQLKTNADFTVGLPQLSKPAPFIFLNGNMVTSFLEIKRSAASDAANDVVFFNNLGQRVHVKSSTQADRITFDVRFLKPGIYYMRYKGKESGCFKIVKM